MAADLLQSFDSAGDRAAAEEAGCGSPRQADARWFENVKGIKYLELIIENIYMNKYHVNENMNENMNEYESVCLGASSSIGLHFLSFQSHLFY